ncbi:MAG: M14 family zinc carboxypeptidase [Thermoanaerobaculia bacterium]|nr:M14 family zinc carboxypeptidase [Thermoanaerobaculia bacterium]
MRLVLALLLLLSPVAAGDDDPVFSTRGVPSGRILAEAERDPSVPLPATVLGHRIGDALTPHDALVRYVRALEAASPRVSAHAYGRTPEGRDLLRVAVSSPANLARLDAIAADLARLADPARTSKDEARAIAERSPAVAWIACGIHGNEVAGPEACAALLYTLAASRSAEVEKLLSALVVVVDPCANPDGHERHVSWWRSVAGAEPDPDPRALENEAPWPSGRGNHFGVDLNRDWAWATQPETRARIAALRALPPQLYVDVHEMGPEQSYFFPPPADPVHPRVPDSTRAWIEAFGAANAEAFDERGWGYFTREVFDLFYPAYGDSWPVFRGMVGMTYEVGGKGGLAHRRRDGAVVTLKERALKHWTALWATLRTAAAGRPRLLADYAEFFRASAAEGRRAFVVPGGQDPSRLSALASLLALQDVEVKVTTRDLPNVPGKGETLPSGSLVVETAQRFGRFAEVLLESQAALAPRFLEEERRRLLSEEDERFFDVTAWSLPIAFGLEARLLPGIGPLAGSTTPWRPAEPASPRGGRFGWLLPGDDAASRRCAARLAASGVRVSVTTKEARAASGPVPAGSYLVAREENRDVPGLEALVGGAVEAANARPRPLEGAATLSGPSLGSSSLLRLKAPRVALLSGDGADPAGIAFLRHALEERLGVRPTLRRPESVGSEGFDGYTALVVPHGNARFRRSLLEEGTAEAIRRFVDGGGVLVAIRGGATALREEPLALSKVARWEPPSAPGEAPADAPADADGAPAPAKPAEPPPPTPEAALERDLERRPLPIPGAALKTQALPGHPFLFGLAAAPAFLVLDGEPPLRLPDALSNVVTVAPDEPLLSGFGWKEALERWKGAAVVQVEEAGRGRVVSFGADPVFRGVWRGSESVFLNAVLLGPSLGAKGW